MKTNQLTPPRAAGQAAHTSPALGLLFREEEIAPYQVAAVKHSASMRDAADALRTIRGFLSLEQISVLGDSCRGEEGAYFRDMLVELAQQIFAMPATYGQQGAADPVAHLHYFAGGNDWYVTEKDVGAVDDAPEQFQSQAFGLVSLMGNESELGYISIRELITHSVELDLHWTPKPISQITAR